MESTTGSRSQEEQWMVQNQCFQIYDIVSRLPPQAQSVNFEIRRENHIEYLTKSLKQLGPNFYVLDANRPWLCYWIIHSIALLGDCVDDKLENDLIDFLSRCQVLLALEYLHMLGIILKPENVLVREDGHIMLSHFDLSLRCAVSPTLVKSSNINAESKKDEKSRPKAEVFNQVTPLPELIDEYLAPEIIKGEGRGLVDVWDIPV